MTTEEPKIRIETREELVYLLAEASAIEHNLMCCYLYAAWSLKRGERDDALRIYNDNLELLETRFRDDYTDPDPLLAETLVMFAALSDAADDASRASALRAKAAQWAPGSVWSGTVSA